VLQEKAQELEAQLEVYMGKFKSIEGTMQQSQSMLLEFKKEMSKSAAAIKKLQKERDELMQQQTKTNVALLDSMKAVRIHTHRHSLFVWFTIGC